MQTNYSRGTSFEHLLKKKYEAKGYSVHRMAGSHSPIDLIAFNENETVLIQCKSSSKEDLPNVKQLLKETEVKEVRTKQQGQWIKVKEECKSNVKLLEELKVPLTTKKLIVWKGTGTNNYWTFKYDDNCYSVMFRGIVWEAMKGLHI